MDNNQSRLKPIIKWAGGKRQILPELLTYFPLEFNNYHEPFVGGASVVMDLWNRGLLRNKHVYLSDIMRPLINLYTIIKNTPQNLINELSNPKYSNTAEAFNRNRTEFNIVKQNDSLQGAALFLYLNRCCFNGMYRENSKGDYNVPFGKQVNPMICNQDCIKSLHTFFSNTLVQVQCVNYLDIEENVQCGDFVYLDPPYYNTFAKYNREAFSEHDQIRLRDFFVRLTAKGCKVALSNSNFDFVKDLYRDIPNVKFFEIKSRRVINCKVESRQSVVTELLVCNY
jgi:DNA adenine methylase